MKKFNFDVTLDANSLLCPNAEAFYSKAYITPIIAANFNVIPGVKHSTKIAINQFSSVLKAESCDFNPSTSTLSSTTVSVCGLQAQVELCKKTLESSFVSLEMSKGSSNWTVQGFMNNFWDTLAQEIQAELAEIMWKGSTTNTGYTGSSAYLALCDGYEKALAADSNVVDVTATAVTVANVIDSLSAVLLAAPAAIKSTKKSDLRLYVASDVYLAFQIAASKGNTISYVTDLLKPNFGGVEIVECPGMTSGQIVYTRVANLVYAFDGLNDSDDLVAIDMSKTIGQATLRTAVWLKAGFQILNPSEIVYFH